VINHTLSTDNANESTTTADQSMEEIEQRTPRTPEGTSPTATPETVDDITMEEMMDLEGQWAN
jgi:uncharacterized membrane protein